MGVWVKCMFLHHGHKGWCIHLPMHFIKYTHTHTHRDTHTHTHTHTFTSIHHHKRSGAHHLVCKDLVHHPNVLQKKSYTLHDSLHLSIISSSPWRLFLRDGV